MTALTHRRLIILGSGPAGYSAAVYAARANRKPLLITGTEQGGQLMITTDVDNWPGDVEGLQGPDLMARMRAHAERFATEIVADQIHTVHLNKRPIELVGDKGGYSCDALIIATGASAQYLGLPSEETYRGRGVSACATCDGFFFKDQQVLVVGGGDTAMEEATFLTKFAEKVTVVHRRDTLRASQIMQDRARANPKVAWLFDSVIEKVVGGQGVGVTGAIVRNLKTGVTSEVAAGGIFMAIGHLPNTALFKGQLETDDGGYLLTRDGTTATSVPGVFAAGDVADQRYRQAITAAGTGCMAAIDAERFLSH
jgi:thioredoxin reductase (NADPH)